MFKDELIALQQKANPRKDITHIVTEFKESIKRDVKYGSKGQAKHVAIKGDFVIKGVEGEFYFCKPDIFKKTYDKA